MVISDGVRGRGTVNLEPGGMLEPDLRPNITQLNLRYFLTEDVVCGFQQHINLTVGEKLVDAFMLS